MKTKNKNVELDVDFIQSRPLTPEEEKGLGEYIQKLKDKKKKSHTDKAAKSQLFTTVHKSNF
jgi:hypothetical protein